MLTTMRNYILNVDLYSYARGERGNQSRILIKILIIILEKHEIELMTIIFNRQTIKFKMHVLTEKDKDCI